MTACSLRLCSLQGTEVTTVEGMGSTKHNQIHPIQVADWVEYYLYQWIATWIQICTLSMRSKFYLEKKKHYRYTDGRNFQNGQQYTEFSRVKLIVAQVLKITSPQVSILIFRVFFVLTFRYKQRFKFNNRLRSFFLLFSSARLSGPGKEIFCNLNFGRSYFREKIHY